jgi:hypothetical protein
MREQPAQRPPINESLVEVAEKDHRHGRRIKTLQHLLDPCASFTRCQPQMRCDNTPRLTAGIDHGLTSPVRRKRSRSHFYFYIDHVFTQGQRLAVALPFTCGRAFPAPEKPLQYNGNSG